MALNFERNVPLDDVESLKRYIGKFLLDTLRKCEEKDYVYCIDYLNNFRTNVCGDKFSDEPVEEVLSPKTPYSDSPRRSPRVTKEENSPRRSPIVAKKEDSPGRLSPRQLPVAKPKENGFSPRSKEETPKESQIIFKSINNSTISRFPSPRRQLLTEKDVNRRNDYVLYEIFEEEELPLPFPRVITQPSPKRIPRSPIEDDPLQERQISIKQNDRLMLEGKNRSVCNIREKFDPTDPKYYKLKLPNDSELICEDDEE